MAAVLGGYSLAMRDPRSAFVANVCGAIATFTVGGSGSFKGYGLVGAAVATSLSLFIAMLFHSILVSPAMNACEQLRTPDSEAS